MGIIIGNWLAFQHTRSLLFRDLEQRGTWGARNLAHDAWKELNQQEIQDLKSRVNALLLQDDVVYVGLVENDGTLRISSGTPLEQQASVVPELPRHACDSLEPLFSYNTVFGKQVVLVSAPILPLNPPDAAARTLSCAGTVHVGMSLHTIDRRLSHMLLTLVLLCSYAIGIGVIGYILAREQILRPISRMTHTMQRMVQGDFREESDPLPSRDEIGKGVRVLSKLLNRTRHTIFDLKNTGTQIFAASKENVNTAKELLESSQRQSGVLAHVSNAFETGAASCDTMAEQAELVASQTETLVESTRKMADMIAQIMSAMQDMCGQTDRNTQRIGQVGEKFPQIGSVVKIINTIADQTRMIAFNASIEAAGAGESGGRFSIVATEVRRLANTVVESLEEIKELVVSIQSATSELTLSSETGTRKVRQGMNVVDETKTMVQQMLETTEAIAHIAEDIAHTAQPYQEEHQTMLKEIGELTDGLQDITAISSQAVELADEMQELAQAFERTLQNVQT
jgi:methyl-accepting chemotaxis protein